MKSKFKGSSTRLNVLERDHANLIITCLPKFSELLINSSENKIFILNFGFS